MSFWQLEGVRFAYPAGPEVLAGVDLQVGAGERVVLAGANGSGKTTLGRLLVGMLKPSAGRLRLEGRDLAGWTLPQVGRRVGYLFQDPQRQLFTGSVLEEVSFGLRFAGHDPATSRQRALEMLSYMGLDHVLERFPFNLSRGEQQRLAMAAVLVLEPSFLLLDEPATGLDREQKRRFCQLLERITRRGTGFILISHDRELVEMLEIDRILRLREGRLGA